MRPYITENELGRNYAGYMPCKSVAVDLYVYIHVESATTYLSHQVCILIVSSEADYSFDYQGSFELGEKI